MKIKRSLSIIILGFSILFVGCSKNIKLVENEIPYTNDKNEEIDNSIIEERYLNVDKYSLTYDEFKYPGESESTVEIHLADSINEDINYKDILLGFTYTSEENPTSLSYKEALSLITKVLPDDIKKVKSVFDKEVGKEYIYYKSGKGNFRVGLSYSKDFNDKTPKEIHKDLVVGIDYSKEILE